MDIAKIGELVEHHYELQAELREVEDLLAIVTQVSQITVAFGNGEKKQEITILPQLAQLILHHQATILRLQLEQIPNSIRQQTMNTTPRLVAGSKNSTTGT